MNNWHLSIVWTHGVSFMLVLVVLGSVEDSVHKIALHVDLVNVTRVLCFLSAINILLRDKMTRS